MSFVSLTNEALLCTICHEMFKNPASARNCGHSFCKSCLEECVKFKDACPTCRQPTGGIVPNFLAQALFDGMNIRCPKRKASFTDMSGKRKSRRGKPRDDGVVAETVISSSKTSCMWEGKLSELDEHIKEHEEEANCACDNMRNLFAIKSKFEENMKDTENKIRNKYETQINDIRQKMRRENAHFKLLSLCRDWMKAGNDILPDFTIYLIFEESKESENEEKFISGLLCGIPGSKETALEGGLFPLLLRWEQYNYVSANFSRGLPFSDISSCRRVPLYKVDRGWQSLQEILLEAQNSLEYLDSNRESKASSLEEYKRVKGKCLNNANVSKEKILKLVNEYTPQVLAKRAIEEKMIRYNETLLQNDVKTISKELEALFPEAITHKH